MRYFRTKDGIWIFSGTHYNGSVVIGRKRKIDFGYCFNKKDIIKESDTIEELCDEFDYYYDETYPHNRCYKEDVLNKWYDLDTDYPLSKEQTQSIKGATWTEKGLIYVAKMNNKGEFELL